jgi:hypothetical protein
MVGLLQDSIQQLANLDEEPLPHFKPLKMRRSPLYNKTREKALAALFLVLGCMFLGLELMIMENHGSIATVCATTVPFAAAFIIALVLKYRERSSIARDRRRTFRAFQAARRRRRRRQGMV